MGVKYNTEKCEHFKSTADVVPKSKVEALKAIIKDHQANEERWQELYADTVNKWEKAYEELEIQLENAKAEVERWKENFNVLDVECSRLEKYESDFYNEVIKAKVELAREIFEEIDDAMIDHARGDTTDHWLFVRIAELKNKYTEN
jgi:predicted nuclease with TOPRIM domain